MEFLELQKSERVGKCRAERSLPPVNALRKNSNSTVNPISYDQREGTPGQTGRVRRDRSAEQLRLPIHRDHGSGKRRMQNQDGACNSVIVNAAYQEEST